MFPIIHQLLMTTKLVFKLLLTPRPFFIELHRHLYIKVMGPRHSVQQQSYIIVLSSPAEEKQAGVWCKLLGYKYCTCAVPQL